MTMLLYAFLPASAAPLLAADVIAGVDGQTLKPIVHEGVCAAVSPIAGAAPEPNRPSIAAFAAALAALIARSDLVPARFGSVWQDEAEARRFLAHRHDYLLGLLDEARGFVELSLSLPDVPWPPPMAREPAPDMPVHSHTSNESAAESGRGYLASRQRAYWQADLAPGALEGPLSDVMRALTPLCNGLRLEPPPTARAFPSLQAVVRREAASDFREQALQTLSRAGIRTVVSGPWPPSAAARSGI
jgi:hypothetical protein